MRNIKTRQKQPIIDICPWQFPDIESQRRSQDAFSSFAISHQPLYHHKISHSLQSVVSDHSSSPVRSYKKPIIMKPSHGRTLTVIKDYFKKHYTEQASEQTQIQSRLVFKQPRKKFVSELTKYQSRSFKKMSVVDFAFNPALVQQNCIMRFGKSQISQKDYPGSKIMKIKQEMIRNKQRKKIDQRQLQIVEGFSPDSKTMPLRVLVRQSTSLKKSPYVVHKSLSRLLHNYIDKSE